MKILKNLKRNLYLYFILVVIFLLLLVFGSFMYKNISSVNKYNRYVNSFYSIPDMYFAQLSHTNEDKDYVDKLEKEYPDGGRYPFVFQVLDEAKKFDINEFGISRHGMYEEYCLAITEVKNNEEFNYTNPSQVFWEENPNSGIFMNSLFGENIKFPIIEGRNFTEEDFKKTDELSVIAGYEYIEEFEIGDTLTLEVQKWGEESENNIVSGKIVGFLEEDIEMFSSALVPEILEADKILLIGVSEEYKEEIEFFSMFKDSSYIGNFIETKNPELVEEKVFELTKSLGYEGKGPILNVISLEEFYEDILTFNTTSFTTYYLIVGVSLIASFFITILVVYLVIRKNRYTYGVLLINGAIKKNIIVSILIEMLVVIGISNILALILSLKYVGEVSLLIFLGFDLIIILITLISSNLILNENRIIEFVRSSEKES